MPNRQDDLLSIGGFANLTRLSQKALRLYAKKGLLVPARIDPANGYRSYRHDQLTTARKIHLLRELGLSLTRIAHLLAADATEAEALLSEERRRLEAKQLRDRRILDHLSGGDAGRTDLAVGVIEIPRQQVLSQTQNITVAGLSAFIDESRRRLAERVQAADAQVTGPAMALFHGPVNRFCDGPVEVCLPLDRTLDVASPLACRRLPACKATVLSIEGDAARFPEILAAYDATWAAIESAGWRHAGPAREIYGRPGSEDAGSEGHTTVARPFQ